MKLTNRHHEAIQMMILDRYSRRQQSKQIAKQLGVHTMTVTAWWRDGGGMKTSRPSMRSN
jgi:hypothetical protein